MRVIETIVILFIFVFFGCEKKITAVAFEQNVFDQLFIKIVDSTYKDQRLYTCFPERGKPIYDKNGKWIGLDTVNQHKRDLECEVKRAALEKDTLDLIIAVGNEGLINEKTDFSKYKSSKFTFKHESEYPGDRDSEYSTWKKNYPKFAGVMYFSRIKFDNKKESGSLNVYYCCGGKCGLGYLVYIKKVSDQWVIVKVKQTSIS
jgi:hypothetical protein